MARTSRAMTAEGVALRSQGPAHSRTRAMHRAFSSRHPPACPGDPPRRERAAAKPGTPPREAWMARTSRAMTAEGMVRQGASVAFRQGKQP